MRARLIRLAAGCGALLLLGLCYAAFIHITGWAIPCPFRLVTGLKCPGCGVTTMCLALLRLDFIGAWQANAGLLLAAPLLLTAVGSMAAQYVRTGTWRIHRRITVCLWIALGILLAHGIWRLL